MVRTAHPHRGWWELGGRGVLQQNGPGCQHWHCKSLAKVARKYHPGIWSLSVASAPCHGPRTHCSRVPAVMVPWPNQCMSQCEQSLSSPLPYALVLSQSAWISPHSGCPSHCSAKPQCDSAGKSHPNSSMRESAVLLLTQIKQVPVWCVVVPEKVGDTAQDTLNTCSSYFMWPGTLKTNKTSLYFHLHMINGKALRHISQIML